MRGRLGRQTCGTSLACRACIARARNCSLFRYWDVGQSTAGQMWQSSTNDDMARVSGRSLKITLTLLLDDDDTRDLALTTNVDGKGKGMADVIAKSTSVTS